jgi:hypothetical protein
MLVTGSCHLVEQRLRFFEIGRAEAFGEPVVDRGKKTASLLRAPDIMP